MAWYAKLWSSVTESSLWSESKDVRLLFVSMLARADAMGFVDASIPGLARLANLTMEETQAALEVLQAPDQYSKNAANEGRRVAVVPGGFMVLNYEEHRNRRDDEKRKEYMRDYMRDYRAGKRKHLLAAVNSGKPRLAQAEAEAEAEAEGEGEGEGEGDQNAATPLSPPPPPPEGFQLQPPPPGKPKGKAKQPKAPKIRPPVPPTLGEVEDYIHEASLTNTTPGEFFDHYAANGWKQANGNPIKDWQAACRNWDRRQLKFSNGTTVTNGSAGKTARELMIERKEAESLEVCKKYAEEHGLQ